MANFGDKGDFASHNTRRTSTANNRPFGEFAALNRLHLSGIQAKPRRLVRDRPFGQSVLASLEEVTVGKWMVHLTGSSLEKVNG